MTIKISRITTIWMIFSALAGLLAGCNPQAGGSKLVSGTNGQPWWNDTVFYEIFVRSYMDSNGDGIGDFNGITQKLDYLADLGVRGLWLMPVFPSPSYHGYDVTDYYTVNPQYGSMDDFKKLLSEAHQRGIRVILDLVVNHTSSQHPWFIQSKETGSPYRNWYIWSDTDPGYLGPWSEKVWHPTAGSGYYYGVFEKGMPDLNYRNPDVTKEMQKIVKFWLDQGVDGYRLDGAKHMLEEGKTQENTPATLEWFKQFKPYYKQISPQAITVGEVWSSSFAVAKYISEGGMDLAFDFDLANGWMSGVIAGNGNKLSNSIKFENNLFPNGQLATFLTNHDMNRVMSQLYGNLDKAKAAAAIYLTAPGVPFIYYGEEIGMLGGKPDELIRTPMQWTPGAQAGFSSGEAWERVNSDNEKVNVETQSKDANSLLSLYKKLIAARNQHEALRVGDLVGVDTNTSKVYAILRTTAKEAVLVLINLDKEPVTNLQLSFTSQNLKGSYSLQALVGEGSFVALNTGENGVVANYQPGTLAPYANLVLQLKSGQ